LLWKRNVQSAKQSTPHLTLNPSIAAMPAPRKLAKQSKIIILAAEPFFQVAER
jgi:hypothetical protein